MNIETYHWQKRIMVANHRPYLMCPDAVAYSEARSTHYHHTGTERLRQKYWSVFQYTVAGRGIFKHKDSTYDIIPGRGFLTYISDPDISYYYPDDAAAPWEFLYITFHDSLRLVKQLTDDNGYVYTLPLEHPALSRFHAFADVSGSTFEMGVGEASLLLQQLFAALVDSGRQNDDQKQAIQWIRRATTLVEANLHLPYNAGMLADDLGVSHAHLCRIFRKDLQISPLTLLNRIKIRHACDLLRNTSRPCREIAESLGYEPGSHFARLFKRTQGMTPNEFRRRGALTL